MRSACHASFDTIQSENNIKLGKTFIFLEYQGLKTKNLINCKNYFTVKKVIYAVRIS